MYRPKGYYPSQKGMNRFFTHVKLNVEDVLFFLDRRNIPYRIEGRTILAYKKAFSAHREHDLIYISMVDPTWWIEKLNGLVRSYKD